MDIFLTEGGIYVIYQVAALPKLTLLYYYRQDGVLLVDVMAARRG